MPRPKGDREMYSFRITTTALTAVQALAVERGETTADTMRTLLGYALQNMPRDRKKPTHH